MAEVNRTRELIRDFARQMVSATSNTALYSAQHGQAQRYTAEACRTLTEALTLEEEISLKVVEDEVVLEDLPLGGSLYTHRFGHLLQTREIGSLRMTRGVTEEELRHLVFTLSLQKDHRDRPRSSDHIHVGRIEIRVKDEDHRDNGDAYLALADLATFERERLLEIYERVRRHQKLSVAGVYDVVSNFVKNFSEQMQTGVALAPLRALDEYTFTHSTNVCLLTLSQAMALGIEGRPLHDIGVAAMLHDIGKLFIPEEVLTKAGKLDEEEWRLMRLHPVKGARHLLDTPGVPRLAVVVAYEHHMRYDFSGYPQAPEGWVQNLCSQMVALSDFFDALRTKRSYREAVEADRIIGMMEEQVGRDINPQLAAVFFEQIRRLPGEGVPGEEPVDPGLPLAL